MSAATSAAMSEVLALLGPPFAVSLMLVAIHAYFGIQVLRRKVVFVDLALAQVAALGATVAFMLGHPTQGAAAYGYSLAATLLAAFLLAFTRQWARRVPQEALIGVVYVTAAGVALLLVDRAPQGAEHLKQILVGNILTASLDELWTIVPLYVAIAGLHWLLAPRLLHSAERGSWIWELVFYATFGVVVTSSVALGGVLLVFSFLIVPAAIGMLHGDRFAGQLVIAWAAGAAASLVGLAASYRWDLPTGATMVCSFGFSLAIAGMLVPLVRRGALEIRRRIVAALRTSFAVTMCASGIWLMIAPKADQPLLDLVEAWSPASPMLYMDAGHARIFADARADAERFRREAQRLDDIEARRRWDGQPLDDQQLRANTSFQRVYGEMRRGEEFVMREIKGRAREDVRWTGGAVLIAAGLWLVPGLRGVARRLIRPNGAKRNEGAG